MPKVVKVYPLNPKQQEAYKKLVAEHIEYCGLFFSDYTIVFYIFKISTLINHDLAAFWSDVHMEELICRT